MTTSRITCRWTTFPPSFALFKSKQRAAHAALSLSMQPTSAARQWRRFAVTVPEND